MAEYADYCPIAMGVEILGDRWTPLVIRELMVGSVRFNEIHRGVPRMSRSLLSQRLRALERWGVVNREAGAPGRPGRYTLTPAGEGLTPIVWAMGHWAAEWRFGDPSDEDCDGLSIIWRMHQHAVVPKLPVERTVVHIALTGPGSAQGWLDMSRRDGMTVCRDDPGLDVDLALEADTKAMNRWLLGLAGFRQIETEGQARLLGPSKLARAFPGWFDTTFFSDGLRRAEQRTSTASPA